NHPNLFGRATTVSFTLAAPADVSLAVYDIAGHRVRALESGHRAAGDHEVRWDGRNEDGLAVANGTYFLKLEAGDQVAAAKLNIIR
ncbi:MAG TPA: FlgD immunoglobulin-like domain containing protein, partial [bacterium]|nr:FlgD immunoglobulin-like domain containing protein [bacterium]